MPPKKTPTKLRALPTAGPKRPKSDDAEVVKRWFDQLPPTIRKATRKAAKYEVCVENSGVMKCSQMRVDTYGWVTLLDVAPTGTDRPHVNVDVRAERIIWALEEPTLRATFA